MYDRQSFEIACVRFVFSVNIHPQTPLPFACQPGFIVTQLCSCDLKSMLRTERRAGRILSEARAHHWLCGVLGAVLHMARNLFLGGEGHTECVKLSRNVSNLAPRTHCDSMLAVLGVVAIASSAWQAFVRVLGAAHEGARYRTQRH